MQRNERYEITYSMCTPSHSGSNILWMSFSFRGLLEAFKVQKHKEIISVFKEFNGQLTKKCKGKATKEGLNDHAVLKLFVHPMFFDLCDVEHTMLNTKHAQALANILRLENDWLSSVDEEMNSKFIKEVNDSVG
ncbi:hypothetical protein V8B97DRAFT_1919818 [Scleroderma yunnanense]